MKPLYVIHFTLFKGGSAITRYKFFENQRQLDVYLMSHPWIKNNCIVFKNIDCEDKSNVKN